MSFQSKVMPKGLICFGQGTEWLNDSSTRLYEGRVKGVSAVLYRLLETLRFVNHCFRSDVSDACC
jgi:hypothetical protein